MNNNSFEIPFADRVIAAALDIPFGKVVSYGDIAKVCGGSGQAARSVSGILARAEKRGIKNIPWHRIVYSKGKVWTNNKQAQYRMKLYKEEGISINEKGYINNFEKHRYCF